MLLDLPALLETMLGMVESSDVFAAGVLEPVRAGFVDVVAEVPVVVVRAGRSDNDINPFNVLYDGARLWLVDWELAFRNDPLADLACAVNNLGDSADVDDVTLAVRVGADPDRTTASRLTLMPPLNHLDDGSMVMSMFIGTSLQPTSLDAPTPDQFRAAAVAGTLLPGSAEACSSSAACTWPCSPAWRCRRPSPVPARSSPPPDGARKVDDRDAAGQRGSS